MKYISYVNKVPKLILDYDFRNSNTFGPGEVYSNVSEEGLSLILNELNFDCSIANNHTGQLIGDSSNITGHFSDGYSSRGAHFSSSSYVSIQNADQIEGSYGSFIFSCEKKNKGVEMVFSNYNNDPLNPKGFEFGINDANKLFFECQSENGPMVFVLDNIPHRKNIFKVDVSSSNGNVRLSWWDPSLEEFYVNSFGCNEKYLGKSSDWFIASGVYCGDDGINYSSEGYSFNGYIDRFVYFDEVITPDEGNLVARSMYETLEVVDAVSGSFEPYITGYNTEFTEIVSGVTGYVDVITGYTEEETITREYYTGENLYGTQSAGGIIYEEVVEPFTSNDSYDRGLTGIYEAIEVNEETYGITGFATGLTSETYTITESEPMFFHSGVSGELYRETKSTPLYSDTKYYLISPKSYNLSGEFPHTMSDSLNGYGPRSYTYLGARNSSKDMVETQQGINLLSVNNFAGINESFNMKRSAVLFSSNLKFNNDSARLVVNGLTQQKGEIDVYTEDNFEQYYDLVFGGFEVFEPEQETFSKGVEILYGDPHLSMMVDSPVIDIIQTGDNYNLEISSLSDYDSTPFSQIKPEGKNVFFNGQKIYEDIDYTIIDGNFNPIGDILGITGHYYTTNDWFSDSQSAHSSNVTGMGLYDLNLSRPIIMDSFVSYLNGVRLDPKAFVYHDSSVDLLEQGKDFIIENEMEEVYNNYIDVSRNEAALLNPPGGYNFTGNDWIMSGISDEFGYVRNENNEIIRGAEPTDEYPEEVLNLKYEDL